MRKCKITVLKTMFNKDLVDEYAVEGTGLCPVHKVGDVFYGNSGKPEGLCDDAWKAIYQYVFALAHTDGSEYVYNGDWVREPGVAICSCNDGLRPVVFKVEVEKDG